MLEHALAEGEAYGHEVERMRRGVEVLIDDHDLQRAFRLMNEAMKRSARGRYPAGARSRSGSN